MSRQMIVAIASIVFASASQFSALAENTVEVKGPDGNVKTTPLTVNTRISFGKTTVDISNEGSSTVSIPYSDVQTIAFVTSEGSGVASVFNGPGLRLRYNPADDTIEVEGYDGKSTTLAISSIAGSSMMSLKGWNGENIDVSSLPGGIYILNIDKTSIKFIKK